MVYKKEVMLEKILVISPHPDDETLGAGGSLLKYKDLGAQLYWLNITNMTPEYGYHPDEIYEWEQILNNVNAQFQFTRFYDLKLKPAGLDEYPKSELIQKIANVIREIEPTMVILPYLYDVHTDHKIVSEAVLSCTKTFRFPYIQKVLCMEILSETEYSAPPHQFVPNVFVDISPYIERKVELLKLYKTEVAAHPFPRSEQNLRCLANFRGSQCNCQQAESFMLLKEIIY